MPKVTTSRSKPPPAGFELIEPTLSELSQKMRLAENESSDGLKRTESEWNIFKIHHQRSRYIYEIYYKRKLISRDLYDWCLKQGYADVNLIAKWRKTGYEKLCCLRCVQVKDTDFGTTCVCRVPKEMLEQGRVIQCTHCGCRGCASGS